MACVNSLYEDAQRIKQNSEQSDDYRTALAGVRELGRLVGLHVEMQSKMKHNPHFDFIWSTEWIELRSAILNALDPFPEAKQAVANAVSYRDPTSTPDTPT